MFCSKCGKEIHDEAVICPECGCKVKKEFSTDRNKWIALLLWFFLGAVGGHRFYVGDARGGVAYTLCFFLGWILLGIPYIVMVIMLIVDLIAILQGKLNDVKLEG